MPKSRKRTGAGAAARRKARRAAAQAAQAGAAEDTETRATERNNLATADGRRMLKRAAGVLAPESEASSGQRRRARGRAKWALRCRFRVTREMAGFLSFEVLDAYLARNDGGSDASYRQATLSIRQRLVEEQARWQREDHPERRQFRRKALEKSRGRAREAINSLSKYGR